MIRRIINWLTYTLHLRKRPIEKPAIETLMDILPIVTTIGIIIGIIKTLPPLSLPWYKRILYTIKRLLNRFRFVVVGY